jgi:hypothetical protein
VEDFAAPQDGRAAWVVGVTLLLWVGSLALGSWWFRRAALNTWWGLAVSACWVFLRSGSLVRTFVVMHDAIHNALFSKRWLNSWTGLVTGIMTGADAPGMHAAADQALLPISLCKTAMFCWCWVTQSSYIYALLAHEQQWYYNER